MTTESEQAKAEAKASNAKISKDLSPFSSSSNSTQSDSRNISSYDSRGVEASKFHTSCGREHSASLKCISQNYEAKALCQPYFDAYKKCKREEHQKLLEERGRNPKPMF